MKPRHIHTSVIGALALLLAVSTLCAADQPAGESKEAAPDVHKKTLLEQIKEGGWVMYPITALSIFTVYLIGDGIIRTGKKRMVPPPLEEGVKNLFRQGDYVGAYNYCKANPSPLTNVLRAGIGLLGEGKQIAEEGMMGELAKENGKVQTWISYLSVVGVCAPMLGLLGTVTGMIGAFGVLGSQGIGDPSALSAKIGEVLTATASGLFIAIPAFMAFYYLRNRAASTVHAIQDVINSLFRKMPYEMLAGVHIGDDELYAAIPNWVEQSAEQATT